jgi:hypothetical protein
MRSKHLFLVLVLAIWAAVAHGQAELVGKPAPALSMSGWHNTGGKALSLKSLKGKVVVLDFWAHW